jgi:hypothetical protein
MVEDLEWDAESGHGQIVAFSQVRPFELLQPQLRQRVQAAAEQGPHLLRAHQIAGGEAVNSRHPRTDPLPGCLTPLGVVGRQAGVALLGRIQSSHLSREVVIARPGGLIVTLSLRESEPLAVTWIGVRSGGALGVLKSGSSEIGGGYVKRVVTVKVTADRVDAS